MPAHGWRRHKRDPALVERDLAAYRDRHPKLFPQFQTERELTNGEKRLAAEVALAVMRFELVPGPARDRAIETLTALAKG